ncbi:SIS domain-containing protein [Pantoea ananatis]|nr:SIS domain-containing protein [Pantoea ananatis]
MRADGLPAADRPGEGENFIASDVSAVIQATRRVIFLEEGDTAELRRDGVQVYDAQDQPVQREPHVSDVSLASLELGPYRHFMQKEIHEQPRAIADTLEALFDAGGFDTALFGGKAEALLADVEGVQILACGTSYYAGLTARYWIEGIAGLPCSVEIPARRDPGHWRRSATESATSGAPAPAPRSAWPRLEPHNALFLGRLHYPIALGVKEITYIHAEGYPAGELKHGPLALVDANMPVVVIAPNDTLLEKVKPSGHALSASGTRRGFPSVCLSRSADDRPRLASRRTRTRTMDVLPGMTRAPRRLPFLSASSCTFSARWRLS